MFLHKFRLLVKLLPLHERGNQSYAIRKFITVPSTNDDNLDFSVFSRTAELLMKESGCRLDHPAAAKFRQHVIDGEWSKVMNTAIYLAVH